MTYVSKQKNETNVQNPLGPAKYCVLTCFLYTLVELSLVDMQRSYHAVLDIAFCFNFICMHLFLLNSLENIPVEVFQQMRQIY